jgi:Raf kinase inhibitor-like YbhB/YbcL family protein
MSVKLLMRQIIALLAVLILIAGCAPAEAPEQMSAEQTSAQSQEVDTMKITSTAFKNNSLLPSKYTCDGEGVSPPLEITSVPKNTRSIALIVDDPDAPLGTFVHWVAWDIPVKGNISEGDTGFSQGTNDFGKQSYGAPCPPSGAHRYFFKAYALDITLELEEGSTKEELVDAMEGHIVAEAELIGKYSRGK